jgi:hypothetical protein
MSVAARFSESFKQLMMRLASGNHAKFETMLARFMCCDILAPLPD